MAVVLGACKHQRLCNVGMEGAQFYGTLKRHLDMSKEFVFGLRQQALFQSFGFFTDGCPSA